MAGRSFGSIVIAFILVSIFMYAVINFGLQLAAHNNLEENIANCEGQGCLQINQTYGQIVSNVTSIEDTSRNLTQAFQADTGKSTLVELTFESIVGTLKVLTSSISSFYQIILLGTARIFGIQNDAIVWGGILSILLIIVLLSAWRAFKTGE